MMIVHSQWRVKVAISLVLLLTLQKADAQSEAGNLLQSSITLNVQRVSFEEILHRLSEQTKLYFIYSSNSVDLRKSLSINLTQRPLREALDILGERMRVTFRSEGKYIIVKPMNETKGISHEERPAVSKHQTLVKPDIDAPSMAPRTRHEIDVQPSIPYSLLKKNLLSCSASAEGIGTSYLKNYFPLNITNPRPNRKILTSVSLMANEYSAGLEIHVGLPVIYAVINSGLMREGYLRYGFGLGTSIPVKPMVALNPIYTFGKLNQEQDYAIDEVMNLVVKDGLKLVGHHHQMKFLFHVQAFRRIGIRLGPTINFLRTTYAYKQGELSYSVLTAATVPAYSGGYYAGPARVGIIRTIYYTPPADYSSYKSWVGFEAGLSYSIKFSAR
jgi:hypothetical protein